MKKAPPPQHRLPSLLAGLTGAVMGVIVVIVIVNFVATGLTFTALVEAAFTKSLVVARSIGALVDHESEPALCGEALNRVGSAFNGDLSLGILNREARPVLDPFGDLQGSKAVLKAFSEGEGRERETLGGQDCLVTAIRAKKTGWIVVVAELARTAIGPSGGALAISTLGLVAAMIFIGAFMAYFSKRFADRLEEFCESARRVAQGDYRMAINEGFSELEPLRADFELMAARVKQREKGEKEAGASLREALQEKEILLREVHHRVKNNLQLISSLISLQAANQGDQPAVALALDRSDSRIKAMALIHEMLYESADFSSLDFGSYLREFAMSCDGTYGPSRPLVRIEIEAASLFLSLDQAIPLGLALNELTSNAFAHGFGVGDDGRVLFLLESRGDRGFLAVEDDGKGLPDGFSLDGAAGLGLSIVLSLVTQLSGRLESSSPAGGGTRFTIGFPLDTKGGSGDPRIRENPRPPAQ